MDATKGANNMKHPLINPESTHYQMIDGVESVERLEQMYTRTQMLAWACVTAMKYRMRIGNKDDSNKEAVKIRTYEDYYKYLATMTDSEYELSVVSRVKVLKPKIPKC